MKLSKLILVLALLTIGSAQAAVSGPARVYGDVIDFNRDYVRLHTTKGTVVVPRSSIKQEKLQPGQHVTAKVNLQKLFTLNKRKPASK